VVLVPDMGGGAGVPAGELRFEGGRRIRSPEGGADLTRLTAPGAFFLIGPSYGTRLSDFKDLIEYASSRLPFYTVAEIVAGKHAVPAEGVAVAP
jgi:hypothetical protein